MPNPITPEMRAALAAIIDQTECGLLAWHDIGEFVENRLPILRALLDALPTVKESLTAEATADAADHSEDARAMVTVDDVIAAAESLARKAESLSDTPEIYPALHALDLAIDAYRAGQSPGDGEMERDAARYRTVRELYWFAQQICARFRIPSEGLTLEAIDAAVDGRTEALRARAGAATTPKLANIPVVSIGAMTEEIDERTRRIREPIDRAIAEVKNGIDEAREALLLQAFKDGTHPGTVEFKWQVMQRGGIVCWLDMHYARPATPEERAEIETQLRAAIERAKP